MKQKKTIKISSQLFKYNFTIKLPKKCHNYYGQYFPWFSKDSKLWSSKKQRFHAYPKLLGKPRDSKHWSSPNTKIPRGSKTTWPSQRFKHLIARKYQDTTRQNDGKWSIFFQNWIWFSKLEPYFKIIHKILRFVKIPQSWFWNLWFRTLGDTNRFRITSIYFRKIISHNVSCKNVEIWK